MMNQQINLYLPEFRPRRDPWTATLLLQLVTGTIALVLLAGGYQYWQHSAQQEQLLTARVQVQQAAAQTAELERELAARADTLEQEREVDRQEARLEQSIRLLTFLSETKLGNLDGFSEYFKDFSRAAPDGLRLTEFGLREGGEQVSVQGIARDSALIPTFTSRLGAGTSPLNQRQFTRFGSNRIDETEDETNPGSGQFYGFVLGTER